MHKTWQAVLLAAALAAGAATAAELTTAERYPLRGEATTITVTDDDGAPVAGAEVEALYRPNSQTANTEAVGRTGADGSLSWAPQDAGIVSLSARRGEEEIARRDVAVRFGGFPPSGIAIMALAGLILFGGATYGFRVLTRD